MPSEIQSNRALLRQCMLFAMALSNPEVRTKITPLHFSHPAIRRAFADLQRVDRGEECDLSELDNLLQEMGVHRGADKAQWAIADRVWDDAVNVRAKELASEISKAPGMGDKLAERMKEVAKDVRAYPHRG